jgi:hypothetical protein
MSSNLHDEPDDDRLIRDAGQLLRRSADEIDATTRALLHRARQQALAEPDAPVRRFPWAASAWQPALGVAAAAAVLAVALWFSRLPEPPLPGPQSAGELSGVTAPSDLALVLDEENLEIIEDLEFFDWLEAGMPGAGNGAADISG